MSHENAAWFLDRRDLLRLLPQSVASWILASPRGERLLGAAAGASALPAGEVKKWDAKWIWCEGEPVPQNFYLYCRKSFTLQGDVAQAGVEVTADSRYKLFVNGRFVGRGPARCDQRWQYYDTYDLRKFLARGENVVSVMVHQYGVPTHNNTLGRGGLLLQGEVREAKGRLTPIEWSAEPDNQAASGRAWIMGPYGKVRPHKQAFTGGRARYWVEGPGTFRVVAEG